MARRVRLPSGLLGMDPSVSLQPATNPGVAGAQPALIRPAFPDRPRGLGLAGGPVLSPVSYAGTMWFDSHTRNVRGFPRALARYANWQSGLGETQVTCGFNSHPCYWQRASLARATSSRGPAATTPLLQRGNGGSIPSGTTGSVVAVSVMGGWSNWKSAPHLPRHIPHWRKYRKYCQVR